ncbi:MAG: hypothetical protein K6G82_09250 [Ruminococcus sp.]|nr:hypothetical protein [Ruminococcus sp.]
MDSIRRKAEEIMTRGDAVIEQHKHRNAIIRRTAALSLGTAAVLMIGISAQLLKAPKKPAPESSGIIIEASEPNNSASSSVTAAASVTTTTTSASESTQKTTKATHSAVTSAVSRYTTPISTTAPSVTTTAVSTAPTETTTAIQTTAACIEGSTACVGTELIETNTSAITKKQIVGILDNDYLLYYAAYKNNETVSVSTTQLESILYEGEISVTYDVSKYENEHATLYSIKEFSPKFVIAVKTSTDSEPKLYWKYLAEFDTFEELTEGTQLEKNLVLNGIYKGYVEPGEEPIGYPSYSDLSELLNSKESKCIAQKFFPSSVSYIIRVRMPELDDGIGIITVIIQPRDGYGYVAFDVLGVKSLYSVSKDIIDEFICKFDENYDPTQ